MRPDKTLQCSQEAEQQFTYMLVPQPSTLAEARLFVGTTLERRFRCVRGGLGVTAAEAAPGS